MAIKIFIDQGHNPVGRPNAGAEGLLGLFESNINYQVGIYLANLLRADPRFEVRLSRPTAQTVLGTDSSTSLIERVRRANAWPADYFISIHTNANVNPMINGSEAYVYRQFSEAYWLGTQMLRGISEIVGTKNNGVLVNRSLFVLRRTKMPAALVELAYITNFSDAQKLRDDQYRFAYGIYIGILRFFGFQQA